MLKALLSRQRCRGMRKILLRERDCFGNGQRMKFWKRLNRESKKQEERCHDLMVETYLLKSHLPMMMSGSQSRSQSWINQTYLLQMLSAIPCSKELKRLFVTSTKRNLMKLKVLMKFPSFVLNEIALIASLLLLPKFRVMRLHFLWGITAKSMKINSSQMKVFSFVTWSTWFS